jgi:hypothetical protein
MVAEAAAGTMVAETGTVAETAAGTVAETAAGTVAETAAAITAAEGNLLRAPFLLPRAYSDYLAWTVPDRQLPVASICGA